VSENENDGCQDRESLKLGRAEERENFEEVDVPSTEYELNKRRDGM